MIYQDVIATDLAKMKTFETQDIQSQYYAEANLNVLPL